MTRRESLTVHACRAMDALLWWAAWKLTKRTWKDELRKETPHTMTTTLTNLTDSELTDRAAELRKALAATEAEIEVREKVADWPTAQYVWGAVRDDDGFDFASLWSRDDGDTYYARGYIAAHRGVWQFRDSTPVTFVPTAEYETLEAAHQAWKDSDYTSEQWRDAVVHASRRLISAAQEVQG